MPCISTQQTPLLIQADELAARLDDPSTVSIDCRFDLLQPAAGRAAWALGHIPGAHYADLDQDLAAPRRPDSGRHPLPDAARLGAALGAWGVTLEHDVYLYDAAGGALAARLWWLLRWMGHGRTALLDGGLQAWEAAGHALSQTAPEQHEQVFSGAAGQMPIVAVDAVAEALQRGAMQLLDARDPQRFAGKTEPIDLVAGHIPGATNWAFQNSLTADGRFLPAPELRAALGEVWADGASPLACMCGSGVTACHIIFALELSGLALAMPDYPALYVGSWSEWITDPQRPVA